MWQLIEHYYSQNYTVFWLAGFFHSWPHISYNGLKKQDSTFDPTNQKYIEVRYDDWINGSLNLLFAVFVFKLNVIFIDSLSRMNFLPPVVNVNLVMEMMRDGWGLGETHRNRYSVSIRYINDINNY